MRDVVALKAKTPVALIIRSRARAADGASLEHMEPRRRAAVLPRGRCPVYRCRDPSGKILRLPLSVSGRLRNTGNLRRARSAPGRPRGSAQRAFRLIGRPAYGRMRSGDELPRMP